jgi:ABC-type proline/glycine betaine transport system ATPase subunit
VLFRLEDVSYARGGRTVLDELSAEIGHGITALVGPSGAGKSTLLRLLNRLADPDSGSVSYRGRDLHDYDVLALRREVALVAQLPALLPGTVAENVLYGPGLVGQECDIAAALTLAGLDPDFAARTARELSVGEQQRVMLARALALRPAVLLLDEPTSALDESARDAVEATLADLRSRLSVDLVVVTHDRAQAARMADREVLLRDGRVVREDPLRT